jgi:hypothetical protein
LQPETIGRLACITLVVTSVAAVRVAAQAAPAAPPGGVWWEVSAGAGGARLTCTICDRTRELGPSLGGAIGAYASERLRVGIEGTAWTHDDGGDRESVYRAGLVAQLHPVPGRGLHVVGGLGWSGYRSEETTYDAPRLTLGAGWDLPLAGSLLVGNRLTLDGSSYASLKAGDERISTSVGLSVVRFGVYLRKR